jgi:Uncharacterized protein conserved in bacteria (DUF2252)
VNATTHVHADAGLLGSRPGCVTINRKVGLMAVNTIVYPSVGERAATAACLGDSDAFDRSIADFSQRYADQNERDYQEFVKAIRSGRLEAREGV